jgi:hypothetical protein
MNKFFIQVFLVLIGIVLIGKISNWFLHYNDFTNQILNIFMFCLLGIAFIITGFSWENKLIKSIFISCGILLITLNFFPKNSILQILGILGILTPMLITKFYKRTEMPNKI